MSIRVTQRGKRAELIIAALRNLPIGETISVDEMAVRCQTTRRRIQEARQIAEDRTDFYIGIVRGYTRLDTDFSKRENVMAVRADIRFRRKQKIAFRQMLNRTIKRQEAAL